MAWYEKPTAKPLLDYGCETQLLRDEDGTIRKGYRFNVFDVGGKAPRLLCYVNDICSSAADARNLVQLFRHNKVALCHVHEVLEDWLDRH
ncbi:MAG: DUF6514 family protein [Oscillospiraceae bacterium]|nr:DUF6514 family protein [Oscillospiraceae bacterium]